MHRLMHQPAAVGCYPTMSVFHRPQVPPVPSLSVQLRMHVGRCRHAWFQATKCLRSPYYPRTRNDVQTEVPLVTIAVQRCRHRLLMPCSKRKGFMGATHLFLCTRASALASPALLESRSRPASRGSHACYPGAPHSGALTDADPASPGAPRRARSRARFRVQDHAQRLARAQHGSRGLNNESRRRRPVVFAPRCWSPNRTCVFRSHPALQRTQLPRGSMSWLAAMTVVGATRDESPIEL